ncbi:MAG: hypothetical protein ABGY75_22670 [Gemmataceae bacterium]
MKIATISGIAVMAFKSPLPDLLIGLVVVGIVLKGGWDILGEAREARRAAESGSAEGAGRENQRDQP